MEALTDLVSGLITRSKESPTQSLVIATVVALIGVGAASYTGLFSSKSDDSNLAPALTEEETKKIMKNIMERLHTTLPKLFRFADQIKQQIASQGQEIDDATLLKTFILPNLETALRDIQEEVLKEEDVDEDDLEDAVTEYIKQGDSELIQIAATIRSIFKRFGANIVDEEEEEEEAKVADSTVATTSSKTSTKKSNKGNKDMSAEEFIKFFKTFQDIQIELTKSTIDDFVEEFGNQLDQTTVGIFQQRLLVAAQQ